MLCVLKSCSKRSVLTFVPLVMSVVGMAYAASVSVLKMFLNSG